MSRVMTAVFWLGLLLLASCNRFFPPVDRQPELVSLTIQASVTEVDPVTLLPRTLSGTITGDFTGTYSETLFDAFFDAEGNVIGASSLSLFTFDPPHGGTLASYNFAENVAPILLLDENQQPVLDQDGNPVVIGLRTAATGSLFNGTGTFAGVFGDLQTDTELSFTGGDQNLGQITSSVSMLITETDPN